jgi:hypothetical protein
MRRVGRSGPANAAGAGPRAARTRADTAQKGKTPRQRLMGIAPARAYPSSSNV